MMPGRMPRDCSQRTSHSTSGVLPVPPTLMLPTTITGTERRVLGSSFLE